MAGPPSRPTYAPPALPPPDVLGVDEELIAGRRPVEEAFVAHRPAHRLLVVPQRRQALEKLVLHATSLRLPIVELEGGSLTALAGFDGHQGVALVVEPRRFATIDDILARAAERGEAPFVLALDSLEDPQNVGTLLRSAEAAGVHGVVFPTRRQAPLTPAAVKASAGAVEHLLLAPVDDLARALTDLRGHGLRVAGAEADAPLTARQSDLRGPLVIVVGSEGQGLGPAVRRRADLFMRIPMRGLVGSLNAAVAGSILLFEAVAQRDPDARLTPPQRVKAWDPGTALEVDDGAPSVAASTAAVSTEAAPAPVAEPARRRVKAGSGEVDQAEAPPAPAVEGEDLLPGEPPSAAVKPKSTGKPKVAIKVKAVAKPKAETRAKASVAAKPKATAKAKATAKPKAAAKPKATKSAVQTEAEPNATPAAKPKGGKPKAASEPPHA